MFLLRIELVAFAVVVVFVMGVDNAVVNVVDMLCVRVCGKERKKKKGKKRKRSFNLYQEVKQLGTTKNSIYRI